MKILITGGTGFIGSALTKKLVAQGHCVSVLTRHVDSVAQKCGPGVLALSSLAAIAPNDNYQVVINLAGEPIFDRPWTAKRKQQIKGSRIGLTEHLITALSAMTEKPALLISGSAIGYYGDQGDALLTEASPPGADFAATLCCDWEQTAFAANTLGIRVCVLRTGLVIAVGGGLLQRMLPLFRLGLGGRLGDGRQWLSWIHRDDWIAIALAIIDNPAMQGVYNATAPHPVNNLGFTHTLATCLNRPAPLPVPASVLKIALGEMSALVLGSQRVLPERLLQLGFSFRYPDLNAALTAELHSHTPTR